MLIVRKMHIARATTAVLQHVKFVLICLFGCTAQAMRDIVGKCLVKDASKRPSAAQLLEHKFFKVN